MCINFHIHFLVIASVANTLFNDSVGNYTLPLNRQFYEDWTNCINMYVQVRGLSALSGELDSLLRCVVSVGEAGASYVNK